ncbi:MAG: acetylxylan esterase [Candidatus Brockarchaeota archaeon]|nr:acetylxylan esterase [Candidatus Brockarchaeota archaeon]MBO3768575.1 acetylxylan esterase [Candidatus Brockarchaeota archaeon]
MKTFYELKKFYAFSFLLNCSKKLRFSFVFIPFLFLFFFLVSPSYQVKLNYYNTSFWDLSSVNSPTNFSLGTWRVIDTNVEIAEVNYTSEIYGNTKVIINGYITRPIQEGTYPAILLMHGSYGTANSMLPFAIELAKRGYVALSISGPGQGKSTGPPESNENRLNLSISPYFSYYYRLTYSALRGVSLLFELPFVNKSAIAVCGASQGGLESIWVAALDKRIRTSVPVVAGGNFSYLISTGSLAIGHIPKNENASSQRALKLAEFFDPIAYAKEIRIPILFLVGTSDEFFPFFSFNETYSSVSSIKSIDMLPNVGHFEVQSAWIYSALIWFDYWLKGEGHLPSVNISYYKVEGDKIEINATGKNVDSVIVNYRYDMPWDRWKTKKLEAKGNSFSGYIEKPIFGSLYFYVGGIVNGEQVVSSEVRSVDSPILDSFVFMLFIFSFMASLFLIVISLGLDWFVSLQRGLILFFFWLSYFLPIIIVSKTIPITIWTFFRTYELHIPQFVTFLFVLSFFVLLFFSSTSDLNLILSLLITSIFSLTFYLTVSSLLGEYVEIIPSSAMIFQLLCLIVVLLETKLRKD